MLRGMHERPHAEHCRRRMEKLLEGDERITRAKARLAAGARKRGPDNKADDETEGDKKDTMEGIVAEEPEGEKKEKAKVVVQLKFAPEFRLLEFAVRDTDEELDEEALLIFEA